MACISTTSCTPLPCIHHFNSPAAMDRVTRPLSDDKHHYWADTTLTDTYKYSFMGTSANNTKHQGHPTSTSISTSLNPSHVHPSPNLTILPSSRLIAPFLSPIKSPITIIPSATCPGSAVYPATAARNPNTSTTCPTSAARPPTTTTRTHHPSGKTRNTARRHRKTC